MGKWGFKERSPREGGQEEPLGWQRGKPPLWVQGHLGKTIRREMPAFTSASSFNWHFLVASCVADHRQLRNRKNTHRCKPEIKALIQTAPTYARQYWNAVHGWSHLILTATQGQRNYQDPHFSDEKLRLRKIKLSQVASWPATHHYCIRLNHMNLPKFDHSGSTKMVISYGSGWYFTSWLKTPSKIQKPPTKAGERDRTGPWAVGHRIQGAARSLALQGTQPLSSYFPHQF